MPEIKVGPPQVALHQGHTVLVTEQDGQISWPSDKGLYYRDTRLISAYALYSNGFTWDLVNSGATAHDTGRFYLTNKPFPSATGDVLARTLSLVLERTVGGGLRETFLVSNYGAVAVSFSLEVAIRSDFADIFEVKGGRVVRRGTIDSSWSQPTQELTVAYRNGMFMRGLQISAQGGQVFYANGRITFPVELAPGASWTGSLVYELLDGEHTVPAPDGPADETEWRSRVLQVETPFSEFDRTYAQAVDDMAALRLPIPCADHMAFVPAAGLPWFVALFGRDTLIASLQTALVYPEFARGTLEALGQYQAHERDDYRDAEPGKIPHELRLGELAQLHLIPHTPYYGTADATPLWLVTLHEFWRCTNDMDCVRSLMDVAEGCLRWIDESGDRDGDGFQEYGTRSGAGYENVGWKDSGEALVMPDGGKVKGPKAIVEIQGYVYDAWRGMAAIYRALGNEARASELTAKADTLFRRFNEVFWNEEEGFYAYCLDGDKKPVWTVASNPGHLLWSGLVPRDRAARVVARLMADDMWSGWGIRTLSSRNPSFNPYSYQNGSVWPHDNSIIARGMKRYGFHNAVNQVAHDVDRAASFFTQRQLPELYSGVERSEHTFPVQYLGANVPQAWAAGSVFMLLKAMLGFEPDAPNGRLVIDPVLPDWLPELVLRNLRVGSWSFDIRFKRGADGTEWTVEKGEAERIVRKGAELA